ncbi:CHAT domain-containing protein [Acanthopleuribacter pedis]|uniref:CHAT domain-containing protein n=1 Tax=Acanthopleuribacter pedis TaxID=442870 RepID=A0A8J7QNW5_9BACT|nr:CHAT domain-containing tetratricopeptide repeat protein [Acanthopleuribacter pedis]MBO1321430.1 CHAT domain-containing protein [Acanthopleuribacter pedis]
MHRHLLPLLLFVPVFGWQHASLFGAPPSLTLADGDRIRLDVAQNTRWSIPLKAGDGLDAQVIQAGIDVVVRFRDPTGQVLLTVDSPNRDQGPEPLSFIAPEDGAYGLEIQPWNPAQQGTGTVLLAVRRLGRVDAALSRRAAAVRHYARAPAHRDAGALDAAAAAYAAAAAAWHHADDVYPRGCALLEQGSALTALGEPADAPLLAARACFANAGDWAMASDAGLKAAASKAARGRRKQAEIFYTEAMDAAVLSGSSAHQARAANNHGWFLHQQGELRRALIAYDQALHHWRETDQAWEHANTLQNAARTYQLLGRLDHAADVLQAAVDLFAPLADPDRQCSLHLDAGWLAYRRKDWATAQKHLNQARRLAAIHLTPKAEAACLDRLGSLAREQGQATTARNHYQQALALYPSDANLARARTTINLSELDLNQGRAERVVAPLRAAAAVVAGAGDQHALLHCHFLLGKAFAATGQHRHEAEMVTRVSEHLTKLADATGTNQQGTALLETRTFYIEYLLDFYARGHVHRREDGAAAKALQLWEGFRARNLATGFGNEATASVLPPSQAAELAAIRSRLITQRAAMTDAERAADAERLEVLHTQVRDLLRQREAVMERLPPTNTAKPQNLGPADWHALVDPGVLVLVYFHGPSRGFVWALTHNSLDFYPLQPIDAALVKVTRQSLRGPAWQAAWPLRRAQLGALLLGPVAKHLPGVRHLAVLGHETSARIPFQVLAPAAGEPPLVERFATVQLASLQTLAQYRNRAATRAPAPRTLAIVGDPVFGAMDPRGTAAKATSTWQPANPELETILQHTGLSRLAPLKHAAREVANIAALVPNSDHARLEGFAANLTRWHQLPPRDFRFLHFATHGLQPGRYPTFSGIVLSLYDAEGRARPGYLDAAVIKQSPLNAELVVLSSCHSGFDGVASSITGPSGLCGAFFEAGAQRLLVSLWPVNDAATTRLMTHFYEELLVKGKRPAAALQAAQIRTAKTPRFSAPFYWAGFVLLGDWR